MANQHNFIGSAHQVNITLAPGLATPSTPVAPAALSSPARPSLPSPPAPADSDHGEQPSSVEAAQPIMLTGGGIPDRLEGLRRCQSVMITEQLIERHIMADQPLEGSLLRLLDEDVREQLRPYHSATSTSILPSELVRYRQDYQGSAWTMQDFLGDSLYELDSLVSIIEELTDEISRMRLAGH